MLEKSWPFVRDIVSDPKRVVDLKILAAKVRNDQMHERGKTLVIFPFLI